MRIGQIVLSGGGALLSYFLVGRFTWPIAAAQDKFPAVWVLILPALGAAIGGVIGWWLGYLLFPPRPKPLLGCSHCGYDIRSITEPRCPECGSAIEEGVLK